MSQNSGVTARTAISRPEPLDYAGRWWMRGFLGLFFVVLYAPIVALVAFSFNDSKRNIVWHGFTTKYYLKAMENDSLISAFVNSLTIAVVNMIVSVILGVAAAVLLWRFRFPFRFAADGLLFLPIVIPEICMGVAMLVFFNQWWPLSLGNIMIAHITFTLSLDDFVITYFTAGPNSITLPVKINAMVRFRSPPKSTLHPPCSSSSPSPFWPCDSKTPK